MKKYLIFEPDGRFHQVGERHDGKPHQLEKGQRIIEVQSHTTDPDCERWDERRAEWVLDTEKRARLDAEISQLMMPRGELIAKVTDLERRLAALEGKHGK